MELEDQVTLYDELCKQIEILEQRKKELGSQILDQMHEKKMEVGGFTVRKVGRLSINISIEKAHALNAVVLKEAVNRDKIKQLIKQGEQIEGVSEIEFV
ncbi:MAG: hypothetical protein K940chlam9_00632 [Chlamydiae bacterium]|nr:hypothetical protein [Chlamydiota bacterium]